MNNNSNTVSNSAKSDKNELSSELKNFFEFDLNKFVKALAHSIDYALMENFSLSNHSWNVAYLSLMISRGLGLPEDEVLDIFYCGLLHDNGFIETTLSFFKKRIFMSKKDMLNYAESLSMHCEVGAENVRGFPFKKLDEKIILYHHENWDGSGPFGLSGDNIPLGARIVRLADWIDTTFNINPYTPNTNDIIEAAKKLSGKLFDPYVVEGFLKISEREKFWFDIFTLDASYLSSFLPENKILADWGYIFTLSDSFVKLIDSKSQFTGYHTTGITEKALIMADYYGYNTQRKFMFATAAALHDIGKLAIPTKILDKPGKLTTREFEIIKFHVYLTKRILRTIPHFEKVASWAGNHHEKLNGTGYPEKKKAANLSYECRLMAALDIFQALTEHRSYRRGMPAEEAIAMMREMVKVDLIDARAVEDIREVFIKQGKINELSVPEPYRLQTTDVAP